jgi:hypothetical protein
VGKPEGTSRLGRTRRRWEDNIKMDLRDMGWSGMDWIDLAQGRDQWRALVIHVNERSGSIRWWEIFEWLSDWWPHEVS